METSLSSSSSSLSSSSSSSPDDLSQHEPTDGEGNSINLISDKVGLMKNLEAHLAINGSDDEGDEQIFLRKRPDDRDGLADDDDLTMASRNELQELFSDDDDDDEDEPMLTKDPITIDDLMSLTTNKNTNIAYFFLQNEIGIAEEDMWKIAHEAGSILGMTANNLRRKIHLMKRLMDLTDDDVRTMLMRHPAVLHLSAKQNVAPTILFLQRSLDLSRQDLRAMIVHFPSILGYSLSNLNSKLNFYLKLCQFTKEEARRLFVTEPKLLTAGVTTGLLPRMHFFVSDLHMPLDGLREMVQKNPRILLCSLELNLRPKLHFYLIKTLGMTLPKVQTLLRKYPQFVNYNLDNTILPMTQYLVQDILFSKDEFSKILFKFPRLVTWSLHKVKHVVGYLRYELGMDASQTKRVLFQAPQVINLNTERTLKPKVQYFRDTFSLTDQELRKVLAGMPTLTICSLESNLKPKIDYLTDIMGGSTANLKAAILLQPTLLGYSLDKRIRPRMEQILEAAVDPKAITVGIPMKDDAFQLWLNGRRIRAAAAAADLSEQTIPAELSPMNENSHGGRIVHWKRERKSPSTTSEIS